MWEIAAKQDLGAAPDPTWPEPCPLFGAGEPARDRADQWGEHRRGRLRENGLDLAHRQRRRRSRTADGGPATPLNRGGGLGVRLLGGPGFPLRLDRAIPAAWNGVDPVGFIDAAAVSSTIVDVSPVSTNGAIVLIRAKNVDRDALSLGCGAATAEPVMARLPFIVAR